MKYPKLPFLVVGQNGDEFDFIGGDSNYGKAMKDFRAAKESGEYEAVYLLNAMPRMRFVDGKKLQAKEAAEAVEVVEEEAKPKRGRKPKAD